ncbi:uncharacterized protein LOC128956784 [Oppia nitens]|uniref:uncharacterized protein LOC128956784 n=1 Tax=Oppia nitens TaxID=1686743 RepID=UPI0023D97EF0|nr:uncharacterized protein LOC128956784 [Oppia nitens]
MLEQTVLWNSKNKQYALVLWSSAWIIMLGSLLAIMLTIIEGCPLFISIMIPVLLLTELMGLVGGWKQHYQLALTYAGIKFALTVLTLIAAVPISLFFPGLAAAILHQCFMSSIIGFIYSCDLAPLSKI